MSSVLTLGDSWTFSGYMRTNLAAQRMVCQVDWLDSGGSTISSTTGAAVIISSSLSPAFTQAVVTSTVPASADGWRLRFISAAGTSFVNWSIGDALVLDGLRAGSSALYFDGSSVSSSSVMYSWADVAQESWSYELSEGQVQPATFGF